MMGEPTALSSLRDRVLHEPLLNIPIPLIIALAIGATLRTFRVGTESLWLDEVFTVQVATEFTLYELVFVLPLSEPHPPFYNVVMWGWIQLAGTSEAAVRAPSVIVGILSIAAIYLLATVLFDEYTAGIAAVLFAISPLQIWYAQEARMYGMLVLLTILSWYFLVRLAEGWTNARALGFVLSGVGLGYLHVFGLFVLASHATLIAWTTIRGRSLVSIRSSIGLFGSIGMLTLPWTALLIHRTIAPDRYPDDPSSWLEAPGLYHFVETTSLFAFGATRHTAPYDVLSHAPGVLLLAVGACVLFFMGYYSFSPDVEQRWPRELISIWLLIPIIVPFVLSFLVRPMFDLRYVIVAAPAFVLLVSHGTRVVRFRHLRYVLIVLLVLGMLVPLPGYYAEPHKDQWGDAAEFVSNEATVDDVVIVVPGWTWYGYSGGFAYYFDRYDIPVFPLYEESEVTAYEHVAAEGETIYLIVSYTDNPDTVVERVEEATGIETSERHEFVGVDVVVFERT